MTPQSKLVNPVEIKIQVNDDPEFKSKVDQICSSIKESGSLFHAPAVKDNMQIIYGSKRVVASILAGLTVIEVKMYPSDLDDSFYKGLALHENLKRYNLPWYEQVVAEKELHELRIDEHGQGKQGKKVGWSLRDTAKELEIGLGTLSEDLRMAEAVMSDPALRKIEDKMTARRVILTKIKQVHQERDARYAAQADADQFNVVLQGSSEVVLGAFKDNTFDVCITDPPWLEFRDDGLIKDRFTLDVFKEVYRVLKHDGFLYAFVSTTDWMIYQREFKTIGFQVQKWPLIWVKEGTLSHGQTSWQYQRDFEPILLAVKGSPALTASMLSSIMVTKAVHSSQLIHPNQKPPEVIKKILEHCTYDGSLVLDPFGGSGEVAVSARDLSRRYVVIERDQTFCAQIKDRLK